jgi:predicted  nucleic acid-binding Zn-ribbon protein
VVSDKQKKDDADLDLLKKAEAVLAEIDRTQGLIDRHADVLAALRIRIEGGPRKSLEELMEAAGEIKGKSSQLDARLSEEATKRKGDLGDLMAQEPKKKKSLDDLL